ncbi:hypothetical protein EC844_13920 [Acinetobacter calcoaceticus]|uniref:Uncharacterized protein n=1 Tax=Acinetobacter calcoaceticus TaxID=471 RepID=A0A4R1X852_ACICA|nr:hypothetical protein EC844_13920 [Acinetobacter calcoaceticus]
MTLDESKFIQQLELIYLELIEDIQPIIELPRKTSIHTWTEEQRFYCQKLIRYSCNLLLKVHLLDKNQTPITLDLDQIEGFEVNQYLDWQIDCIEFDHISALIWVAVYFQAETKVVSDSLNLPEKVAAKKIPAKKIIIALFSASILLIIFFLTYDNDLISKGSFALACLCLLYICGQLMAFHHSKKPEDDPRTSLLVSAYFARQIAIFATQKLDLDNSDES